MVSDRHCVPGSRVVVDWFRPPRPAWASSFFLTHYHADHYGGLTPRWTEKKIYASEATARLVVQHLGVAAQLVVGMPLDQRFAVDEEGGALSATFLDANHCPGSALVLFESRDGRRYLHTGDMRYHPRMKLYPQIRDGAQVDVLFQDTTYAHQKYRFPSQDEAIEMVVSTAAAEARGALGRLLVLVATYTIGKERVLRALAEKFGTRVYVSEPKNRVLRLLELEYHDAVFTTDPLESNLHVTPWEGFVESVPWGFKPHYEKMKELMHTENVRRRGATGESDYFSRAIGFVPTGWSYDVKGKMSTHAKASCKIFGVPYSEHSSFTELKEWIGFVRPKKLVPTVGGDTPAKRGAIVGSFRGLIDSNAAMSEFVGMFKKGASNQREAPQEAAADGEQTAAKRARRAGGDVVCEESQENPGTAGGAGTDGAGRTEGTEETNGADGAAKDARIVTLGATEPHEKVTRPSPSRSTLSALGRVGGGIAGSAQSVAEPGPADAPKQRVPVRRKLGEPPRGARQATLSNFFKPVPR